MVNLRSATPILVLAALFGCCFAQQQGKDLDSLIDEVFSNNPPKGGVETPVTRGPNDGSLQPEDRGPNLQPNDDDTGGIPGVGSCTCVPYYLCNNGSVNTNGEGIIDIRINEGPCPSYLDVCCKKEDEVQVPITPTPPPVKRVGCGHRNPDGVGFRIKGDKDNEAQFGEFPWMVAVLREESIEGQPQKLNVYQCGGSLIHPRVVLTAAHCVHGGNKNQPPKRYKVRAGEWDTQTKKELYPHQDRDVKSFVIHSQYYAGALHNDIALLFLNEPLEIADNVNVVCLPEPQSNFDSQRECYASGWGKDSFGKEGKYQVILKKISLPMVRHDVCEQSLRKTRLGQYFELHRSFVCAGGIKGKDTCKGDGGGPLVCPSKGTRYVQTGIVAWGIGCGETDTPGVYVNVALFRDWIDEQLAFNNIDNRSYQIE